MIEYYTTNRDIISNNNIKQMSKMKKEKDGKIVFLYTSYILSFIKNKKNFTLVLSTSLAVLVAILA